MNRTVVAETRRDSDSELLKAYVRDNSESAFSELYQRYAGFVYSACRRRFSGNSALVDEAVQGVFLVLARKAGGLIGCDTLGKWLHRTAMFVCMGIINRQGRRTKHEDAFRQLAEVEMTTTQENSAPWADIREQLDLVVDRLPARVREVVLLHYFEGREQREIAEMMGTSYGNVRRLLMRGREKMRKMLKKEGCAVTGLVFARGLPEVGLWRPETEVLQRIWETLQTYLWGGAAATASVAETVDSVLRTMRWLAIKKAAMTTAAVAVAGGATVGGWIALDVMDQPDNVPATAPVVETPPEPSSQRKVPGAGQLRWRTDFESDRYEDWVVLKDWPFSSVSEGSRGHVALHRLELGGRRSRVMIIQRLPGAGWGPGAGWPAVRHKRAGGASVPGPYILSYDFWRMARTGRPGGWERHALAVCGREAGENVLKGAVLENAGCLEFSWYVDGIKQHGQQHSFPFSISHRMLTDPPLIMPFKAGTAGVGEIIIDNLEVREWDPTG